LKPPIEFGLLRWANSSTVFNVIFSWMTLMTDLDFLEALPMSPPPNGAPPLDGAHYREMAHGLRKLAHQCRFAGARNEILQLAASYDRGADYFDGKER
jgi:hypothetical protein